MPVQRPIIGCTTYRKHVQQENPIDVFGLMPSYIEAIKAAGGIPLLIPLGYDEEALATIAHRLDGLLIPGGGDIEPTAYQGGEYHPSMYGIDPERDATELTLIRLAVNLAKPVLAICRGIQVFNVALGGTLWGDIASQVPMAITHHNPNGLSRNHLSHKVEATPGSLVARLMGSVNFGVNSLHHQAIRDLAPSLKATAIAPDGLIEAVEVPEHPFALGVQWHPELLVDDDPNVLSLFRGMIEAARQEMNRESLPVMA